MENNFRTELCTTHSVRWWQGNQCKAASSATEKAMFSWKTSTGTGARKQQRQKMQRKLPSAKAHAAQKLRAWLQQWAAINFLLTFQNWADNTWIVSPQNANLIIIYYKVNLSRPQIKLLKTMDIKWISQAREYVWSLPLPPVWLQFKDQLLRGC